MCIACVDAMVENEMHVVCGDAKTFELTFMSLVILASCTGALVLVTGMMVPIFWVAVFTASAEASKGCVRVVWECAMG